MTDQKLRASLIRLAHAKPELRAEILPLLKEAKGAKIEIAGKSYGAGDLLENRNVFWKDVWAELQDRFGPKFGPNDESPAWEAWNKFSHILDEIKHLGKTDPAEDTEPKRERQLKKLEKAYEAIQQEIKKAPSKTAAGKQVTHLPLMASAKKTAGIGTMQVNYIKRDALELVEAVQSQEAVEIMFLQLLDSCTAFAKYGLKNMAVSRILDKAVDLLADTEGNTLDTTGEPSRTFID